MTLASSLAQDPNSEGHFIGSLTNGTRICDGWRIRKGFHANLSTQASGGRCLEGHAPKPAFSHFIQVRRESGKAAQVVLL